MRIVVEADPSIGQPATTYAEYRLFTALSRIGGEPAAGARVVLARAPGPESGERVSCALSVTRAGADELRVSATGPHACAAVDRAIDRLARRSGQERTLSS
jgi:hypothetical protein